MDFMTLAEIKLYRYQLPFVKPLPLKNKTLSHRDGLIIELISSDGLKGYGDVAPLPGFSSESLTKAEHELRKVSEELPGLALPHNLEKLEGGFAKWLAEFHLSSSAQFGLEMATLALLSQQRKISLSKLLCGADPVPVPVNGLLIGETADICAQARELLAQGFKSFKLKVGTLSLKDDIARVKAISDILRGKALLRLDGNQAWELDDAIIFFKEVGMDVVEYIEEPLAKIDDIPAFYNEALIPVAVDESLRDNELEKFRELDGIDIVVVKPMICGGIERSWRLIQEARERGMQVVVSSAFESGVGVSCLVHLAACTNHHVAAGLDTFRWFAQDILATPLTIEHGTIDVRSPEYKDIRPRPELLAEV